MVCTNEVGEALSACVPTRKLCTQNAMMGCLAMKCNFHVHI